MTTTCTYINCVEQTWIRLLFVFIVISFEI